MRLAAALTPLSLNPPLDVLSKGAPLEWLPLGWSSWLRRFGISGAEMMGLTVQALVPILDSCMRELRQGGFAAQGEFSSSTVWKGKWTSSAQQPLGKRALGGVELGLLSGLVPFR